MNDLRFPMFIPLEHKKIMVFGAGKVAYRRINTLLLFHAAITVVAPFVCKELEDLITKKQIEWIEGNYPSIEISMDTFLVLAATNNDEINEMIYKECKNNHILVNNAGNQEQCDFFFPAVIKTSDVVIGIAGDGTNHKKISATAKKIREDLRGEIDA